MTEFEKQLIERLENLESEVRYLKASQGFAHLSSTSIVGTDYVAKLFGCKKVSVVRKRCGTDSLKPVRLKPLGFVKSEVDRAHKEFTKTPVERAIEAEIGANLRKRK